MEAELERRSTSREQVLTVLRRAGRAGVLNIDLNHLAYRYGARIHELRRLGYHIDRDYVSPGIFRYTLVTTGNMTGA